MVRAYNVALARRAATLQREGEVRLGTMGKGQVAVEEVIVTRAGMLAGKRIREIRWPHDCVVATIRRGGEVLIPNGDTIIEAGDRLVVVVEPDGAEQVRRMGGR